MVCIFSVDQLSFILVVLLQVPLHESNLSESHRLLIFSMDGTKLQSCDLGDYVKQVLSVSVMTTGHLVVTDYREHFVYVFDRQCRMIRRIGGPGETPGKLRHPTFVCLGENDRIFVSDSENHRIQVWECQICQQCLPLHVRWFSSSLPIRFSCTGNLKCK